MGTFDSPTQASDFIASLRSPSHTLHATVHLRSFAADVQCGCSLQSLRWVEVGSKREVFNDLVSLSNPNAWAAVMGNHNSATQSILSSTNPLMSQLEGMAIKAAASFGGNCASAAKLSADQTVKKIEEVLRSRTKCTIHDLLGTQQQISGYPPSVTRVDNHAALKVKANYFDEELGVTVPILVPQQQQQLVVQPPSKTSVDMTLSPPPSTSSPTLPHTVPQVDTHPRLPPSLLSTASLTDSEKDVLNPSNDL